MDRPVSELCGPSSIHEVQTVPLHLFRALQLQAAGATIYDTYVSRAEYLTSKSLSPDDVPSVFATKLLKVSNSGSSAEAVPVVRLDWIVRTHWAVDP